MATAHTPKVTHHKATGQAVVRLNGRDHYLGKYGTPEALARYHQLIANWLANGRQIVAQSVEFKVNDLILAFLRHSEGHYLHADGTPTSELTLVRLAVKPLKDLHGKTPAAGFGPLALKAVRQKMIDSGLSRGVVNAHISRLRRMFKWGVENELVPPSVYQGLAAVAGLLSAGTQNQPVRAE